MTQARSLPRPPPARGGDLGAQLPLPLRDGVGGRGGLGAVEPLLAFLLALAFYVSLYAGLPYHDVARLVAQIESNRFVWDIGHIFLQPATLLWHRWLGFGEAAVMSQKHINSFATAAAIGIFYALLMRLRLPGWQRILAAALLAGSCSLITLAPTGHMKLLAFPFINAGLYALVVWEQRLAAGERVSRRLLILGAVWLGLGAAFLASVLATPPFVGLAILAARRRARAAWHTAFGDAIGFGIVCGALFLACAAFGYITFAGLPLTLGGLEHSVVAKADLRPGFFGLKDAVGRAVFGVGNDMIAAPVLGSVGRAWLGGEIPSAGPYLPTLLAQGIPWFATLLLVAAIGLRAVWGAARGAACLVPLAFFAGALAWGSWYSLNDPEMWFQLTAPTILLFLLLFPNRLVRPLLPLWAAATLAVNLAVIGVPTAAYPFRRAGAELRAAFTPKDLLLEFAAYPGGAYLGFFNTPGVPRIAVDKLYFADRDPAAFFAALRTRIDATLTNGGRVIAFGVLDPRMWDAPWGLLAARGMPKARVEGFFAHNYRIKKLPPIAGLQDAEVLPRI